jgi:hypothetical protein
MWTGKVSNLQVLGVKSDAVVCRGVSHEIAPQIQYYAASSSWPKSALCNKDIPRFARGEKTRKNSTRLRTTFCKLPYCGLNAEFEHVLCGLAGGLGGVECSGS